MSTNDASRVHNGSWPSHRHGAVASGLVMLCSMGGVSHAAADQRLILEEVVVSATRAGAESLQDVPMAISALSPDDLATKGLVAMEDFLRSVPGVVLNSASTGFNRIAIRGLVNTWLDFTQLQDRSPVAMYLDDIPIGLNMSNPDMRVVELERIEVIRGPQGTLYGASSMAGTIRYLTRKPDPTDLSGDIEAQTSSTERGGLNWNVSGALNLPLVRDTLALRLSAYRELQDGWIDNVGTGQNDANSLANTQGRAALRWLPSQALTVDASVTYHKLDRNGEDAIYRDIGAYESSTAAGFNDDQKIFNLTVGYDVGGWDLVSSSSYVDRAFEFMTSNDFPIEAIFGVPMSAPSSQRNSIETFAQEIRAVSKPGRLRWQVGAFYSDGERKFVQDSYAEGLDALIGISSTDLFAPHPDEAYYADIRVEDEEWALFGEGTYELSDEFSVTAGMRYFDFKGPVSYFQGGIAGTDASGLPVTVAATEKANGVNPKLVVTYEPNEDFMVYAEVARGFRYGGVTYPVPESFCAASLAAQGLTSAPLTFDPDHVWSYSLGEKGTLGQGRATLDAAVFLVNWADVQVTRGLDCGYVFTTNDGRMRSTGVELETHIRVTPEFVIGLSATYTDAHALGGQDDGQQTAFFPHWLGTLSADYIWTLLAGEMTFSAGYSYRGEMGDGTPVNTPSSGVVNASVNYSSGPWQMGIFGTNLTDDEQIGSQIDFTTDPGDLVFLGRPRTIGVRLQRTF